MSMALLLEGVRDYLRSQNELPNGDQWGRQQVGIQFKSMPPATAGQFFLSLDDGGVDAPSNPSYYLKEIYTITIGVWRRMGTTPANRRGQQLLADDIYRDQITTLEDLERIAIKQLHEKPVVTQSVNDQFGLPSEALGDRFQGRLYYTGRSTNETTGLPDSPSEVFIGRKLRFRGMLRVQRIENMG